MLKQLEIRNYALINKIELSFGKGLCVITGETGAGKSILLGGLSLTSGKRAQQGLQKDTDKKSIVEATFIINKYNLNKIFKQNELDYDKETIIRRELLPNGKSRAFINDTPVKLEIISELTEKLIDIHSQHQSLELAKKDFQFDLIDTISNNNELLNKYKQELKQYKQLQKQIENLKTDLLTSQQSLDYKSFQLKELQEASLNNINIDKLEQQLKQLEHSQEITLILNESISKIEHDELGIQSLLINLRNSFDKIADFNPEFKEISNRLESMNIEIQDISQEISHLAEDNEFEADKKEKLQIQFDNITNLLIKHKVTDINELIELRETLSKEVSDLSDIEYNLHKLNDKLKHKKEILKKVADKIHTNRKASIPKLIDKIEAILKKLSMKHTLLKIDMEKSNDFLTNGTDILHFKISSNNGKNYGDIKKIASGGELSRIMLAVKTVLSKYKNLPGIVFDEIDSGISGEAAQNMADVLKEMSKNMQVIVITHLPQIAAAGNMHYKVYKQINGEIETNVKLLSKQERTEEIAEMIEGKSPSKSAKMHAAHLIDINLNI